MKVHEIVAQVGLDKETVASELGVETSGNYWLTEVDDGQARAYIASKGVEAPPPSAPPQDPPLPPKSRSVRFWSPKRGHSLPYSGADTDKDIQFDDWVFEASSDDSRVAFLRKTDVQNRTRIVEILDKPFAEAEDGVEFAMYLDSLIYTGAARTDGPSREGVQSVRAFLREDELAKLVTAERNTADGIKRAVRLTKSTSRKLAAGE